MKSELIAPCGINCRLCYGYIRPRKSSRCFGCRAPAGQKSKSCTSCKIVICEKRNMNGWDTCAPCDTLCRRLKELDKRYRTKYHTSMIENLNHIREHGMESFLKQQEERFTCPICGKIVCVHKAECPSCKAAVWEKLG